MEENTEEVTNEQQPPTEGENIENIEGGESEAPSDIEVPPTGGGQPVGDPAADPLNELLELVKKALEPEENPQIYNSIYQTEDYAITLVHEITLGDMLLGTLLSVLIVVILLGRLLGGARRW